ncbi:MAG: hypothetical protein GXY83_09570 [Rhodopirellula sp.]|nr:hypothetical protein [Rhodopirellula sp.]
MGAFLDFSGSSAFGCGLGGGVRQAVEKKMTEKKMGTRVLAIFFSIIIFFSLYFVCSIRPGHSGILHLKAEEPFFQCRQEEFRPSTVAVHGFLTMIAQVVPIGRIRSSAAGFSAAGGRGDSPSIGRVSLARSPQYGIVAWAPEARSIRAVIQPRQTTPSLKRSGNTPGGIFGKR